MSTNVGAVDFELLLDSSKFNQGINTAGITVQKSGIEGSLKKIGKAAITAFSVKAVIDFGKACVDTATETSNAWIGLNSILTGQNKSFKQAQNFINEYVSDGLVPLNNAVAAYKNLALRGYNSDQIQKTMEALKNSATFARQSTYTLGEAVQTATEGLKNENSVVVDNAGVTKNVAKMWEDYAASIGKTTNNLTQQEKIQAEVNGILEETKFQSNDAAIYANTFSGKVAQLNTAFTNMKNAIGNVIQPIAKLFIPIITSAVNVVTNLFSSLGNLLSLFGLKADSVSTLSDGLKNVTDNATNTSDAVGAIGESAKQSAKDMKSLASFDTAQILQSNDNSSSGGGGSGASSTGSDIGNTLANTMSETNSGMDELTKKAYKLFDIFKKGFSEGFGNFDFSSLTNSLKGIKDSLIEIFTNSDVKNAIGEWGKNAVETLGIIAGSITSIGTTIADNLLGGLNLFLSQNKNKIQENLIRTFDISMRWQDLWKSLYLTIADIFTVFRGDTAKQITADLISIFTDVFANITNIINTLMTDLLDIIVTPIVENKDLIKTTIEGMLEPISKVLRTIKQGVEDTFSKFWEVYDTYISPAVENIKNGFSSILNTVLTVWNDNIKPILDEWASKFDTLWKEHLQPTVNAFLEFIGKLINGISELWNKWMVPFINWIVKTIVPILSPIFETIGNVFMNVWGIISDIVGGIWNVLSGLIDFISGVFTGNWDKAWQGIQSIFSGIWNAIKGVFEGIWNSIKDIFSGVINWIKNGLSAWGQTISGIWNSIWSGISNFVSNIWNGIKTAISNVINGIKNTISNILNGIKNIWNNIWTGMKNTVVNIFNGIWNAIKRVINSILSGIESMANGVVNGVNAIIRVLNNLRFTIPDWVPVFGGKSFGFNIPQLNRISLPRLAEGAYVKANTPQLAMIGDNRHQGEYVAPEDKLLDLYKQANKEMGFGNDAKVIQLLNRIVQLLELSGNQDFNLYIDGYELLKRLEKVYKKKNFARNGG